MTRPSRVVRSAWLLCALLQLALPGAAAWGDARLEQQSLRRAGVGHVESHSTPACGRAHLADCALCRFVSAAFETSRPAAVEIPPPARTVPAPSGRVLHAVVVRERLPDSRAPPLLS